MDPCRAARASTLTECKCDHIRSCIPTYEYGCSSCGHQWEEVQRITAPATETCPKCSQPLAHRLISGGTNFILKGGGWDSDLYSSPKAASKNSDSNGSGSSDTGSTGSATKSDAKTESKPAGSESKTSSTPAPAASGGSGDGS